MNLLTAAAIPVFILLFWTYTAYVVGNFPTLSGKRIILLIAHPDDEAMFFAPTLMALARPELGNHIKILCLSTGNADGIGHVRKKELEESGLRLGLRSKEDVVVIDDKNLPDSMTADWDAGLISRFLIQIFAPKLAKTAPNKPINAGIDTILTFDASGVSNHPNHIACYRGSLEFIKALTAGRPGWNCPVALYTLSSIPLWRKYTSVMDSFPTMLSILWDFVTGKATRGSKRHPQRDMRSAAEKSKQLGEDGAAEQPTPLLFIASIFELPKALGAMVRAHKSQMRWFRWGWISIGRYMIINDLRKIKAV